MNMIYKLISIVTLLCAMLIRPVTMLAATDITATPEPTLLPRIYLPIVLADESAPSPTRTPSPTTTLMPTRTTTPTLPPTQTRTPTLTATPQISGTQEWVSAYYIGYQQNLLPINDLDFSIWGAGVPRTSHLHANISRRPEMTIDCRTFSANTIP